MNSGAFRGAEPHGRPSGLAGPGSKPSTASARSSGRATPLPPTEASRSRSSGAAGRRRGRSA
eukprot:10938702-Alexandrium_andersonii.AAC.1